MAIKNLKKVNFNYLYEVAKQKKVKITDMSMSLGMGSSYISDCKRKGGMIDSHIKIICALYDADYDKLTSVAEEPINASSSDETTKFILNSLNKLSERVALLENQNHDVILSMKEEVVLLLQQMTKFGQCEEHQFKSKAKSYGYSQELIQFAIEHLKCKREVTAGKVWLIRKSK